MSHTPPRARSPTPTRHTTPRRPAPDNQFHTISLMMANNINTHFNPSSAPQVAVAGSDAPLMPCAYCGTFATRAHQIKCPKRPVGCPDCHQQDLTAGSLSAHHGVCPAVVVHCPGCTEPINRGALPRHISQCSAAHFTCPDCGQAFWRSDEYIHHAFPRCRSGFVNCQLCNELISTAVLAQHYVVCAQRNLRGSVATPIRAPPAPTTPLRSGGRGGNASLTQKSPVSLLALHHQLSEQQLATRSRRASSMSHRSATTRDSHHSQGFMAVTQSSSKRSVANDPFSPPKPSLYINRPLTPRRSTTPLRATAKTQPARSPSVPSIPTAVAVPMDVRPVPSPVNPDNWLTADSPTTLPASAAPRGRSLGSDGELTGFTGKEPPTQTSTGAVRRDWSPLRGARVVPLTVEQAREAASKSPSRSRRDSPPTSPARSHVPQTTVVPTTPLDKMKDHNIVSSSKSPPRARASESPIRSSRLQLHEAMGKQLLPRSAPQCDEPLSHSSRREREGAEELPVSTGVLPPPQAMGGGIPRSISPHHSFNSYANRQKVHQQARIGSTPLRAPATLSIVSGATTPRRHQHKLARPLMSANSEEELRADPRFDRLTKAEKEAAVRDILLKVHSAKARAVALERETLRRESLSHSAENCIQQSSLLLSHNNSSGYMRKNVTSPVRSHGGRPYKL